MEGKYDFQIFFPRTHLYSINHDLENQQTQIDTQPMSNKINTTFVGLVPLSVFLHTNDCYFLANFFVILFYFFKFLIFF
jgi:hypothetical protein